jgi:chromosome partitioning related protein ParA
MYVLSVNATKGGVGKSTICMHLGGLFADMGFRTLLVDADYQPSLTKAYPITKRASQGIFSAITMGAIAPINISETEIHNLDILVSDIAQNDISGWFRHRLDNDVRMKRVLRCSYALDNYDIIIIDTQGAQGPLQDTCLLAGDEILMPVTPDMFAVREFRDTTIEVLARLSTGREPPGPVRVLINRMERLRDSKQMVSIIREDCKHVGHKISLLSTIIPSTKAFKEAASNGIPVHRHEFAKRDPNSPTAYEVMHQLAWELYPNFVGTYANWDGAPPIDFNEISDAEKGESNIEIVNNKNVVSLGKLEVSAIA